VCVANRKRIRVRHPSVELSTSKGEAKIGTKAKDVSNNQNYKPDPTITDSRRPTLSSIGKRSGTTRKRKVCVNYIAGM